jgi:hypothetical protein
MAMTGMILSTLLLIQAHPGGPACFVSGEVYSSSTETTAALSPTNCPINIAQDGRRITMTSPKWVVHVIIPEDIGKQTFLYEWGQAEAKIGDRVVVVSYQPAPGA